VVLRGSQHQGDEVKPIPDEYFEVPRCLASYPNSVERDHEQGLAAPSRSIQKFRSTIREEDPAYGEVLKGARFDVEVEVGSFLRWLNREISIGRERQLRRRRSQRLFDYRFWSIETALCWIAFRDSNCLEAGRDETKRSGRRDQYQAAESQPEISLLRELQDGRLQAQEQDRVLQQSYWAECTPNRRERIAAHLITNAVGAMARRTIVVVDEADDLLAGLDEDNSFDRRGSKVFMNRLVERAAAPTIWITNDVDRLGPAIIRRMSLALRFSKPTLSVRKTLVARIAESTDFRLSETALLELARTPAPPALIENAIRSAAHIRGSARDARTILDSGLRALGRRDAPTESEPFRFDPMLSSADVDLARLADQVARSPARALSFCLSGPPGAGKSAYARHLAERLDLDVLEKRFSDLSSMWLGESEKAIAGAFEEAADLRAFLIIDEADSLLRDRLAAKHSWEITQVNEMLTQMERHPYPYACTTNAPELLDAAAARRFLFKVRFLPMNADQIAKAFRGAFGSDPPGFVLKLGGLTPADFATVARKARVLGERDSRTFAQWLEYEAQAKPDAERPRIGF
jgi:SpoVK/Ycf46/Vps4 family AAA+-type ATPase